MNLLEYFTSVAASAICVSCISRFFKSDKLIKVLGNIFICLTVLGPLVEVDLRGMLPELQVFSQTADTIISDATASAELNQREIIKSRTEAYICDKAASLGCVITASISLSDDEPYTPKAVTIEGNISPHAKSELSQIIETDLGIQPEEQEWNGIK